MREMEYAPPPNLGTWEYFLARAAKDLKQVVFRIPKPYLVARRIAPLNSYRVFYRPARRDKTWPGEKARDWRHFERKVTREGNLYLARSELDEDYVELGKIYEVFLSPTSAEVKSVPDLDSWEGFVKSLAGRLPRKEFIIPHTYTRAGRFPAGQAYIIYLRPAASNDCWPHVPNRNWRLLVKSVSTKRSEDSYVFLLSEKEATSAPFSSSKPYELWCYPASWGR